MAGSRQMVYQDAVAGAWLGKYGRRRQLGQQGKYCLSRRVIFVLPYLLEIRTFYP